MNNWKKVKLGQIGRIITGKTPQTKESGFWGSEILFITPSDDLDGKYISNTKRKLSNIVKEKFKNQIIPQYSICVSCIGSDLGKVVINNYKCMTNQQINSLVVNRQIANNNFMYYKLKQIGKFINYVSKTSTAIPIINKSFFSNLEINLPPLKDQQAIANVLSSFDNKIELNNKMIKNLEEQAQALYKHWFDNSVCEKQDVTLGAFFPVITGRKNANTATPQGVYPFFSCSQEVLKTNEYTFDTSAILVAGNGDFNVKFYKGKFDAYQRTYVLIPYNQKLFGVLYYIVKNSLNKITAGFRGSVIKFITKGNIEDFHVQIPRDFEKHENIIIFNNIVYKILHLQQENQKLAEMRDYLLPKLMSGEIKVSTEIK